jgi:TP901 family phage tail tape measure protein
VRTVKVVIEASVAGAIANVRAFKGTVADLGSELDRAAAKHPERLNKISNATGALGIGMAVAFGVITKSAMDFDQQMSHVVAVSDDGAKSLGAFRQAAINAGRDTAFTATQAGQAEEELAKAGVSTADILGGALTGALNLAAAGSLDLGTAATIAAQAMTEFGLSGKDVGHIADVLTSGANKSTADVEGLGLALGQVGGVAHQTGLTLEDTVGVLARFAQGGMNGEEAGTTLKQTLLKLEAPSKQAADLMKQLGINIYDAQGKFVGITGVAQQLQNSLSGLDEAQRNAALGTLFGARAIRGATILYQEGAVGIQSWIDGVNQTGAAGDTAALKLDNLSGDLHKLLGSLQAVAIQSSGGTTSGLRFLAQGAEGAVNAFLGMPKPVQETATVLLGVGAAGLLATSGLLKVKTTVSGAMEALRGIGPVGERAAGALSMIGRAGGIIGIAAIGIFAAAEGLKALGDWMGKSSAPVSRDIDKLTSSLKDFATVGTTTGYMAQVFGSDLSKLAADMDAVAKSNAYLAAHPANKEFMSAGGKGGGNFANVDAARQRAQNNQPTTDIKALDDALSNLAKNGGATQAKIAFDQITQSLLAQGKPLADINKMFPQYAAAATDAAAATTGVAQGFGTLASNTSLLTGGLQDAIDHGETLTDVFKQLNGAALDLLGAQINEEQSLADLKDKWDQHGNSLKLDTQAGRDNLKMVKDAIEGAAQAAQAKYNETGSVQDATDTYNAYITKLRETLHNLHLSDDQINQIIADYGQMPAAVTTQINTPGAQQAASVTQHVNDELDRIDGRHASASVSVNVNSGQLNHVLDQLSRLPGGGNRWGGMYEHAAVGLLRDASLYSAVNPGRYMIAEPATHGEAFIPRSGNLQRSRAIADYVVGNWLGGSTSWGGSHSGGGGGVMGLAMTLSVDAAAGRPAEQMLAQWVARSVKEGTLVLQVNGQPVRVG